MVEKREEDAIHFQTLLYYLPWLDRRFICKTQFARRTKTIQAERKKRHVSKSLTKSGIPLPLTKISQFVPPNSVSSIAAHAYAIGLL